MLGSRTMVRGKGEASRGVVRKRALYEAAFLSSTKASGYSRDTFVEAHFGEPALRVWSHDEPGLSKVPGVAED